MAADARHGAGIRVGDRRIGDDERVFVIAEAGVNHNGDPDLALRLVDAAADAGADAVKFQTWITEKLVARDAVAADYQQRTTRSTSQYDLLQSLELDPAVYPELHDRAAACGIVFLSTPDEEDSADLLERLGVPAFKIGSAEVTNLPFLRHVARKRRPIILSTGMSTLDEVAAAVGAIEAEGGSELILLHCVSAYPADPGDANLRAMRTLREAFGHPVGFSDHTLGTEVAVAAVALGACVIEKHLTLDRALPGPDHEASLDCAGFAALVRSIRAAEAALGDGVKRPVAAEEDARGTVRRAVVTARALEAGVELEDGDLVLRRATGGIDAGRLPELLGRRLRRDVAAGAVLTLDALE